MSVPSKLFISKVKKVVEDQDHLKKIHLYEEMDLPQITAVFETLTDLQYRHVQSIRYSHYLDCGN